RRQVRRGRLHPDVLIPGKAWHPDLFRWRGSAGGSSSHASPERRTPPPCCVASRESKPGRSTLLETMRIVIPELSFVVLIGPSGSGKSTFARRHFRPTEILGSDTFRGLVSDDENDQTATEDALEALYSVARKRLRRGRLTVLDATNVQPESRKKAVAVAREFERLPIAIVFDLPEQVCNERNR